jgi:hypothetical protein
VSILNPKSPIREVISGVERAIRHLPTEQAGDIRQETSRIIKHSKPQKANNSKAERDALRALRDNQDILVLLAGKGNASVVMTSKDYSEKMEEILGDQNYNILTTDPTKAVERRTTKLIKKSEIAEQVAKTLISIDTVAPRLY